MSSYRSVTVDPDGATISVDIVLSSTGSRASAYTTAAASSSISLPATISSATEFFLAQGYDYDVISTLGGHEIDRTSVGVGDRAVNPPVVRPSLSIGETEDLATGGLPAGGTSGDVLTKQSSTDGDADWAAPSGASGLVVVRLAFAFDTVGIVTPGVTIATPPAGSLFMGCGISVPTTVFDGTTPNGVIGFLGEADNQALSLNDLTAVDGDHDAAGHLKFVGGGSSGFTDMEYFDGTAVTVRVSDGADGNPNIPTPMSQGAGFAFLLYVPPTAFT